MIKSNKAFEKADASKRILNNIIVNYNQIKVCPHSFWVKMGPPNLKL